LENCVLKEIMLVIAAYFLGSIPTGLLLGKAFGVDIRSTGSGNIGATNVYRTLGKKVGILTLAGDCLKGLVPVLAMKYLGSSDLWIALAGLAAFLGHVYTVFLGFKGGKGVATALGVFLGISPISVLCSLMIFLLVVMKWRYVSLASITAACAMPVFVIVIEHKSFPALLAIVIASIVIQKHRENIERLKAGTENKFRA
jgi:glycerol-3-phosphate acyltransferase PlsY